MNDILTRECKKVQERPIKSKKAQESARKRKTMKESARDCRLKMSASAKRKIARALLVLRIPI
jgi:hypothetical protein